MCYLTGCGGQEEESPRGKRCPGRGYTNTGRDTEEEGLLHGEPTMTLVSDKLSLRSHSRRGQDLMELMNG